MTTDDIIDMIRRILPELAGTPIRPLLTSTRADLAPVDRHVRGWYAAYLDSMLHPSSERGVAFVIADDRIAADAAAFWPGREAEFVRAAVASTALHELSHAVDVGWITSPLHAVDMALARDTIQAFTTDVDRQPPPIDHGARFVRAAMHAVYRAQQAGFRDVDAGLVFHGRAYGLPTWHAWFDALADELVDAVDVPVRELLDVPPPDVFTQLCSEYFE